MNTNVSRTPPKPAASLKFTSGIVLEYSSSPTPEQLGRHESTMDLYLPVGEPRRGFIEWDIPDLDRVEEIGLLFDVADDGARTLTDYDGVFSLPDEAVSLMLSAGIKVSNDFNEGSYFQVGNNPPLPFWDLVRANDSDEGLYQWALHAQVGDRFPDGAGCTRVR